MGDVVGITAIVSLLGFSLTAMVIWLAEGSLSRAQLARGYLFSIGAGLVNACLAIEAAAAMARNLAELWLLSMPLLGVAGAYFLYTSEYQKRQRIQHLYECSDLLQRSGAADVAVPELLTQISQVFRAEMAEVVMLPVATGNSTRDHHHAAPWPGAQARRGGRPRLPRGVDDGSRLGDARARHPLGERVAGGARVARAPGPEGRDAHLAVG